MISNNHVRCCRFSSFSYMISKDFEEGLVNLCSNRYVKRWGTTDTSAPFEEGTTICCSLPVEIRDLFCKGMYG